MVLVPADADDLIDGVVRSRLAQLEAWPEFADAPFFVADLGQVLRLHQRWKVAFPSIQPFYGEYVPWSLWTSRIKMFC